MYEPRGARGATQLPLPLTSLVGREHDIAQVGTLLQSGQARLLTLTGPGGVGKTRLALQVAASLYGSFANGGYFVSLAPVSNPDLVFSTIAQTLGVRESPGEPILESLCAALKGKHLLLVLDNFEQVVPAGPRVLELLQCAPQLQVLVTSRTVLRVYGEQEYQVLPLALPDVSQMESSEQLARYESVRLFIERARAVKPNFAVTNSNAPAIAEICRRLDGLPLAIELAAARVKLMSPQALLKRLDHTLPLLTRGATTLPYRHQTLRDAIAWSYNLLSEDEKRLFRRLSVFVGGCTLEAAEAVYAGDSREGADVPQLDDLAALVDKSLLRHVEQEDGEPRFFMLETIREFAFEQLGVAGEEQVIGKRHTEFYLALTERADPELVGANQAAWLDKLGIEHDNLRAALMRAQLAGDTETVLRMGGALLFFWYTRGYLKEGREWLSEGLAADGDVPPDVRAKALNALGNLAGAQSDYEGARACHEQVLALWQELGDKQGISMALSNLGNSARLLGDYERARTLREQSIAIQREMGLHRSVLAAVNLYDLGSIVWTLGDHAEARRLLEEALDIQRELNDKRGMASTLDRMGMIALSEGRLEEARAYQEDSLRLSRELGSRAGIANSLHTLGEIAAETGDYSMARAHFEESLRLRQEIGNKRGIAECLQGLAALAHGQPEPRRLVTLLAVVDALHKSIGSPFASRMRDIQERWLSFARSKLRSEEFQSLWERGTRMSLEEAIDLALRAPQADIEAALQAEYQKAVSTPPHLASSPEDNLTAREVEVLRLVAVGLSNPEIAEHLSLSVFTVQAHLRSVFSKINVKTRAAAVHFAFEHSLN